MMKIQKLFLGFMAIAIIAIFGCGAPGTDGPGGSTGSIMIAVNGMAKIMGPPADYLDIADYEITGTGPTPFTVNTAGNTTIDNLLPGIYALSVDARNGSAVLIGSGGATGIDVQPGVTAIATVIIEETAGVGSFSLDLAWEPSIIDVPDISGFLKDGGGVQTDMVFTAVDPVLATAESLTEDLVNGFYMNIVQIYDGSVLSCGYADIVRIVSNYMTEGSVFLHAVEGHGVLDINFDLDFFQPLHFTGTPAEGSYNIYGSGTMPLSVIEDDSIPFTGAWYRNGDPIGTGAAYTVDGDDLLVGESFRFDFIGWSLDTERAGAAHYIITKTDLDPDQLTVQWTGTKTVYRMAIFTHPTPTTVYNQTFGGVVGPNEKTVPLGAGQYKVVLYEGDPEMAYEYYLDAIGTGDATVITLDGLSPVTVDLGTLDFAL